MHNLSHTFSKIFHPKYYIRHQLTIMYTMLLMLRSVHNLYETFAKLRCLMGRKYAVAAKPFSIIYIFLVQWCLPPPLLCIHQHCINPCLLINELVRVGVCVCHMCMYTAIMIYSLSVKTKWHNLTTDNVIHRAEVCSPWRWVRPVAHLTSYWRWWSVLYRVYIGNWLWLWF